MKKLAVLLPTYNAAVYLRESIDSVLNQTFGDFDLYVYDDCSTDNTEEIISEYKDSRLFYQKNRVNSGIAVTLNKGLEELLPHYEYIARMDADDWCYPERFEKQMDFLNKNREVVLCGTQGYWLKDINQNPVSCWEYPTSDEYIRVYLLFGASFGHSSVIFRSDIFQKFNLRYNENIATCEDWDLWTRVVKIGQVANLPDFMMKYRILESSNHRSELKKNKHFNERCVIISNYWADFGIDINPDLVFQYYYENTFLSKNEFIFSAKKMISIFNSLYVNNLKDLNQEERANFSYMLTRKILDFWKRSKFSRLDLMIWIVLIKEVKFLNKMKMIGSIIR